jgi:hypothetical protein
MAKIFKLRFFLLTILLSMLLLSATPSFLPAAHALEPTLQEKGVSILSNVAGIDVAEYAVTSRKTPTYQYFDVLSEDTIRCTLESQNSKVDVLYTFAKGKLHIMHVLETEGSPSMTKQAPTIAATAKSFLNDYTSFSGDPLYSALSLMLNRVDTSKNSTVTVENVKLRVKAKSDEVTFSWIYTSNSVDAA